MAGDCCSATSGLRQSCGSPAVSGRGFEACSRESGRRESKPRLRLPWRAIRHEPNPWPKTWGNASRWTRRCSRFGCPRFRRNWRWTEKNPAAALNILQAASPYRVRANSRSSTIFPASIRRICTRRGILGGRTGQCCRRRVSEDSRPQRHRLELLDGSVGASGSGSCQRLAGENLAGSGCRCRPRPGARRLQRFPHPLERRRPRHPHPEGSQSGVREAAITVRTWGLKWDRAG